MHVVREARAEEAVRPSTGMRGPYDTRQRLRLFARVVQDAGREAVLLLVRGAQGARALQDLRIHQGQGGMNEMQMAIPERHVL